MILAAIIVSLNAMTNTDHTVQSAQKENSYHVEAQAGLLGVGLSIGISSKTDEFYLLRTKADSYVQGAAASIGLHHRKFYTGPHYFEYGVGAMAFGTDEWAVVQPTEYGTHARRGSGNREYNENLIRIPLFLNKVEPIQG